MMRVIVPFKLTQCPEFQSLTKNQQDNCALFCHVLFIRQSDTAEFVDIPVSYFACFLKRKQVRRTRERLIDFEVIECDWVYRARSEVANKAFGYRLHPSVKLQDCGDYPLKSENARKRFTGFFDASSDPVGVEFSSKLTGVYGALADKLNHVVLPLESAKKVLRDLPAHKVPSAQQSVFEMQQRKLRASVCEYGRFHTNITNMQRDLRECLRWNASGQLLPFSEVDVVCSQPTLLCKLLMETISQRVLDEYMTVTASDIYQTIAEDLNIDRQSVKNCFVQFLMGPYFEIAPNNPKLSPDKRRTLMGIQTWYRNQFPEVLDFLKVEKTNPEYARILKADPRRKRKHCQPFVCLSHRLQRLEADILLKQCCGKLLRHRPAMPLLTVHDSILTTDPFVERTEHAIHQCFAFEGVQIRTKIKSSVPKNGRRETMQTG